MSAADVAVRPRTCGVRAGIFGSGWAGPIPPAEAGTGTEAEAAPAPVATSAAAIAATAKRESALPLVRTLSWAT